MFAMNSIRDVNDMVNHFFNGFDTEMILNGYNSDLQ